MTAMNILFVSNVLPRNYIGLSWSVPASVLAQMKYDNVMWINSNKDTLEHWHDVPCFHKVEEYGGLTLENFPEPFNHPDVVIFEGFYNDIKEVFLANQLKKRRIPYVIVPRSALTYQAYHNHAWLKKKIAHLIFYNRFIKNSLSIQYLTEQEKIDSEKVFHHSSFIIPNGFSTPKIFKTDFNKDSIKAIFIGRLTTYQKGIDVLIPALGRIKSELKEANFSLDIYGPFHQETENIRDLIHSLSLDDIVLLKGEIRGKEKETVINNADLFVLTSRFEGHPMGLIEALAYGLPCIVTPGTNMLAEVKKYDAGWTTELDEESVSRAFLEIINHKSEFLNKSVNARELASLYNWDRIALKMHETLNSLLKTEPTLKRSIF